MSVLLPQPEVRAQLTTLASHGYTVKEQWLGDYFDGISARKTAAGHVIEIFSGSANGHHEDHMHTPLVYLDDKRVASCRNVMHAFRVAELRALVTNAARGAA